MFTLHAFTARLLDYSINMYWFSHVSTIVDLRNKNLLGSNYNNSCIYIYIYIYTIVYTCIHTLYNLLVICISIYIYIYIYIYRERENYIYIYIYTYKYIYIYMYYMYSGGSSQAYRQAIRNRHNYFSQHNTEIIIKSTWLNRHTNVS